MELFGSSARGASEETLQMDGEDMRLIMFSWPPIVTSCSADPRDHIIRHLPISLVACNAQRVAYHNKILIFFTTSKMCNFF